jgi:hypothetical protein
MLPKRRNSVKREFRFFMIVDIMLLIGRAFDALLFTFTLSPELG